MSRSVSTLRPGPGHLVARRQVARLTTLALVLLAAVVPASGASGVTGASATVTTPGGFTSLAPSRLLDTRIGVGAPTAPVGAGGTVALQVTGRGGVPASGVSAVVLNVTVTAPTAPVGYVTVYGHGTTRPLASNLNFVAGQTVPNLVVAPVGANGKVALYNGSTGTIQLIADVAGYYVAGAPTVAGAFGSLAPARLLDTRIGVGAPTAPVGAGGTVALQVTGRGGVPASGVSAVVLNVTVTAPTAPVGYVTVYGHGTTRPLASNLNFVAGQTVPNLVVAPVGANGKVALYNGSTGTIQLIADVAGYYVAGAPTVAGAFGSLAPARLLDTRIGVGAPTAPVGAGGTVALQVTGRGGVPASGVSAVVLNVTVTAPTAPVGYVTVYGDGTTRPLASNLNFVAGQTVPNLVVAPVGANGKVALYNGSTGTIQLIADVAGYYRSEAPTAPGPVTSVIAAPTSTSIALSWTNPSDASFTGVMIRRALGATPPATATAGTLVVDAAKPATSYTNTGLTSGTQYSYALFAHNGVPVYAAAATATSTTLAPGKSAWTWGENSSGQLGDGTTTARSTPVQVGTNTQWAQVSAGYVHTVAVKTDGTLWAWGSNGSGQLGDGTTTDRLSPVQVGTDTHWASASAGGDRTVAVKTDGTLWAWGSNGNGQLGDGTTTDRLSPVQVGTDTHWASASAGDSHTAAVKTDGTLWAWGNNYYGQLGDGTTTERLAPVQVGTDTHWASASAGDSHTAAVKTDGTLWAWGYNWNGQLGDGTTTNRSAPVQVGIDTHWAQVAASGHTVAVKTDGTLWAWGNNWNGQLGDGTTTNRSAPVQVGTDTHWAQVAAGAEHTVAVKTDGTLWAWGYNSDGELGDGTTIDRWSPVQVGTGTHWTQVSAGGYHTVALRS